jgi:hypothetical protein
MFSSGKSVLLLIYICVYTFYDRVFNVFNSRLVLKLLFSSRCAFYFYQFHFMPAQIMAGWSATVGLVARDHPLTEQIGKSHLSFGVDHNKEVCC